jgi:NADPH-dependent glutamate synthase beta subunit-like oxidoreductase/Pyruvate/2-oxoacid:ferredoxin oxidoreductase delta subunit
MGLLKKTDKKKPMRMGGASTTQQSNLRPSQVEKLAPCIANCPAGNDVRKWLNIIAQREKTKLSQEEAYLQAFESLAATNPFPALLGRVCPHPCEAHCNRVHKEGAVSINALERFIGDWSLEKKVPLPKVEGEAAKTESIGVVGAGPAGLSFAYQMARRGYPVTVYEKTDKPGGMTYWGIPFYRLPESVLTAEVQRIRDLGVDIQFNTKLGRDITAAQLKQKHKAVFVAIGADQARMLRIPGEDGEGVWGGTDYLFQVNEGKKVDVGRKVAVIGGGNTAIDAARIARRSGAEVTILYRRTRDEMPAIEPEIEDALKEQVQIEYLVAPVEIKRTGGKVTAVVVQKMELGEPDDSGRRRPVPIEGSEYEIPIDTVIAAVSQAPDFDSLGELKPADRWYKQDPWFQVAEGVYAGGDVINPDLVTTAVGQGRKAAEAMHAMLQGKDKPILKDPRPEIPPERIKKEVEDVYPTKQPVQQAHRPVEEWLTKADEEIALGLDEAQFLEEVSRCYSCGLCFGCERCWMFCTPSCFAKVDVPGPGHYYSIKLETCDGCKKCGDECPCGFIDLS